MRSDYANVLPRNAGNRRRQPAPPPKRKGPPMLLVLVVLALVAGFAYFLWDLKATTSVPEPSKTVEQKPQVRKTAEPVAQSSAAATAPVTTPIPLPSQNTTKDANALPPKPQEKWTYREELENKRVEVDLPDRSDQPSRPYQMQCGSFRKESQAQEMKAVIAFQGLEAMVRKVDTSSGVWYKVVLGPYPGKRKAETDRHELQRVGLNGCMIWFWES